MHAAHTSTTGDAEVRWMGETFAYFLATGEQTAGAFSLIDEQAESKNARYLLLTTPRHGEFYRAIMLASRPGGLPPLESMQESQIEQACVHYGAEFVGSLPDQSD